MYGNGLVVVSLVKVCRAWHVGNVEGGSEYRALFDIHLMVLLYCRSSRQGKAAQRHQAVSEANVGRVPVDNKAAAEDGLMS